MTDYYSLIHGILSNKGETYLERYPEAEIRNNFKISALAWSSAKEIFWDSINKKDMQVESLRLSMFRGRAIHEYIQRRLKKDKFIDEYSLRYQTDDYIPNEKGYALIGHVDAVNFQNRVILEFKTTNSEKGERWKQWTVQAGGYSHLLYLETGFKFKAIIFCINEALNNLTQKELTIDDVTNSWKVILDRADESYKRKFLN